MKLKCPDCGHNGPFLVHADTFIRLHGDGETYDKSSDAIDWDSSSPCKCPECDFSGDLGCFEEDE